jgi:hypothetical protein
LPSLTNGTGLSISFPLRRCGPRGETPATIERPPRYRGVAARRDPDDV